MSSTPILSVFLVGLFTLGGGGCGTSVKATNPDPQFVEGTASCVRIQAEIAGLDEEIRLRLDRAYDVKRRMKVFGGVGTELYKQVVADDEKIIQARAKRAEATYRAQQVNSVSCDIPRDLWDATIAEYDCIQPIRDSDGYDLFMGTCEAEYNERVANIK